MTAPEWVTFTNLDQPLFDGAGVSKRELVDYLDAICNRIVPVLRDRPLSVIRARPGQAPFMQKNVPKGAPSWLRTATWWAETSQRDVSYPVCDDRRSLLWLGNQRAIEYHPALHTVSDPDHVTHLVLDLDPPPDAELSVVVSVVRLVRQALADAQLQGALKTSGAKGFHVFVPIDDRLSMEDAAHALRAIAARVERLDPEIATTEFMKEDRHGKVFVDATRAGGATVIAAYSPRVRPGLPVSFPITWDELDSVRPSEITVRTALDRLGDRDPWADAMPSAQMISQDLIEEGREIPTPRVKAMHEGKRRARQQRTAKPEGA